MSRPIDRCHEISQYPPIKADVTAAAAAHKYQGSVVRSCAAEGDSGVAISVSTLLRRPGHPRKNPYALTPAVVGALLTLAAAAASAQDEAPRPSAIEHALVEYLCRTVHGPTMIGTDVYQSCYAEQLTSLREPFGANLSNLTRADRRSLDAWCGPMQSAGDRDAYLACLNRQLVRLKEQRAAKAKQAEPEAQEEVLASEPAAAPVEIVAAATPPPPPQASSSRLWLALAIGGVASAGGTAFMLLRGKRGPKLTPCRGCGAGVEGSGDMCANCRHEAAEARRRAIAERAEEERLQAEQAQRDAEQQAEEERREQARRDEVLRLAAEVEQRRREEQERRLERARAADAPDNQVFDPYAVLGLAADATADGIRAAYEKAKAKYDPVHYEHLGVELQAHFKTKADDVERAFQMLYASE